MSFNIRWPNPDDGANRWGLRRDLVVRTIERQSPDVLGVQEAFAFQVDYLVKQLPGYTVIGAGRDDGKRAGEMTAVLFREARFDLADHGHLWLSETPNIPGSVGWDAALTRMATWVLLDDKHSTQRWLVLNTHFDHVGRQARHESAKLIGRFVRAKQIIYGDPIRVIVMGDFNSAVDGKPYDALCADTDGPRLIDTFAAHHAGDPPKDQGTFNRFRGRQTGARIDWLLTSTNLTVQDAQIDTYHEAGRYPADHFPVTARLRIPR